MSRQPDKVQQAEQPTAAAPEPERAGRVEVDARGRNVWRWARDVIDSTSVLLKRLENKDLALEPTQKVPVVRDDAPAKGGKGAKGGAPPKEQMSLEEEPATSKKAQHPAMQRERRRDGGGGFDPYNTR